MADQPNDPKEKPKLRVAPRGRDASQINPEEEITLEELLARRGLEGDGEGEEVLVRRIDKRLALRESGDWPWTRRFVGVVVIGIAFYIGWSILNAKSVELMRINAAEKKRLALTQAAVQANSPPIAPSQVKEEASAKAAALNPDTLMPATLDPSTVETISECTKGTNAFRQLDFDKEKISKGEATLESIFKPVLSQREGESRRQLNLQNVRIIAPGKQEWRLHASPLTQNGELHLKLFRVAKDGLPEVMEFPEAIKDLKDAKLSDDAVARFLQQAEEPGRALEIERHESWSYPGKAGAQVIWSDAHIFDMQVFMDGKFLACSRGVRAGSPTVNCKCVDHATQK